MKRLPEQFISRMRELLGDELAAFLACYELPPVRGVRVNTLKISVSGFLELFSYGLAQSGIIEEGFALTAQAAQLGCHPYHMAGLFYMQEPSAMSAIAALDARPGMKVLDMCAAPGGKSGGIAARMQGKGLLISNEVVPARAKTLCRTLERMGAPNTAVTSAQPGAIAAALPRYFDRVLVDAPCSGEGMFRKDDGAIAEWSPGHVTTCAARQRGILEDAYRALAPGGALVYSTCTFNREENEDVIESFLQRHQDMSPEFMHRLYPHRVRGEGHFVARLNKAGNGAEPQPPMRLRTCNEAAYREFVANTFASPLPCPAYSLEDGRVLLIDGELPAGLRQLRLLTAGVCAGELRGARFMPAHALFLSTLGSGVRHAVELPPNSSGIREYFTGNTLPAPDAVRGWCAVRSGGHAVGFGKAVDGTLKNHLPKGLRMSGQ